MYQCDTCHRFIDQSGLGYRDESRTECRDCHSHDARCDDSQEPGKSLERQIVEFLGRYVEGGCDGVYLGALVPKFHPLAKYHTLADAIKDALKD